MKYESELVFILDRSGSMRGLETDTIGGFNGMIDKQKKLESTCVVSTVLFDNQFDVIHNRVDLKEIKALTSSDYQVRGSTALLDAIGRSIRKISNLHRHMNVNERPDKVLFVIITDGMENASKEFRYESIKKMIEIEKEEYGWEFLFLGANMDAISVAEQMGISRNRASNYIPDMLNTKRNYEVVDEVISEFRSEFRINDNWSDKINKDVTKKK